MCTINKLVTRPTRANMGESCPSNAPLAHIPYIVWASGRGPENQEAKPISINTGNKIKTTMWLPGDLDANQIDWSDVNAAAEPSPEELSRCRAVILERVTAGA
jgi:hypothetical protein